MTSILTETGDQEYIGDDLDEFYSEATKKQMVESDKEYTEVLKRLGQKAHHHDHNLSEAEQIEEETGEHGLKMSTSLQDFLDGKVEEDHHDDHEHHEHKHEDKKEGEPEALEP